MTISRLRDSRSGRGSSGIGTLKAAKRRLREWEMETENNGTGNNVNYDGNTSTTTSLFLPVTPHKRDRFSLNLDFSSVHQQQEQRPPGLPLSSRQDDNFAIITQSSDSEMEMNEEEDYNEEVNYNQGDMFRFTPSSLEREQRRKKCRMGSYVFTATSTPSDKSPPSANTQVPWWKRKVDTTNNARSGSTMCSVHPHRLSSIAGTGVSSPSLASSCRCHVCQETIPLHEHSCVNPTTSSNNLQKEQCATHAFASNNHHGGGTGLVTAQTPPVVKVIKKNSLLAYFSKSSKPSSVTSLSHSATNYAQSNATKTATAVTSTMARTMEQCAYCDKSTCTSCLRHCDGCGSGIYAPRYCTFCSTTDYRGAEERTFCSSCFEDCQDRNGDRLRNQSYSHSHGYRNSSRHDEVMDLS